LDDPPEFSPPTPGYHATVTDLMVRLLRRGYDALGEDRTAREGGDAYVSRMLGRRSLVVCGEEGVRFFYDEDRVKRHHAMPFPLAGLLFGRGAVHGLDDEKHAERREVFTEVLAPARFGILVQTAAGRLEDAAGRWKGRVDLFDELVELYGITVIEWAGADVSRRQARAMSHVLATVVDGFGFSMPAYAKAWVARRRANRWATAQVRSVRQGRHTPPPGSALAAWAATDLKDTVAGVELLNVLRPTVAVAWFGAFAAVAIEGHPRWRQRLATARVRPEHVAFAHEVRRTGPFAPALTGRLRGTTSYSGIDMAAGQRVVLDLWGTNHHRTRYDAPEEFRPERFLEHPPGADDLVPQGGGPPSGHRCPGEPLVVDLLAETVRVLAGVDYALASDGSFDRHRIPTRPDDRLVVSGRRT